MGHWRNLDRLISEGVDLEAHPVLGFLIAEDLGGLFRFAEDLGYRGAQEGYVSKCDLCLVLRKYLVSRKDFEELSPREFYAHVE